MIWSKRKRKASGQLGAFMSDSSEMEGKYRCSGTVLIDARFRGEISSQDTLVIGESGVVHADVHTARLVVRGEFVGDVIASERVELKKGARFTGDIESPVIVMEEGAVHDGSCRMAKAESAAAQPLSLVAPLKA